MKLSKKVNKAFRRIGASGAIARKSLTAPQLPDTVSVSGAVTGGGLSPGILDNNEAAAKRNSVDSAIHSGDFIYWFAIEHFSTRSEGLSCQQSTRSAINAYFDGGAQAAYKLVDILNSHDFRGEERIRLLEFASGYGRITRHLKRYPHIDLVASDIHIEAVDFISNALGVKAIPSCSKPEDFCPAAKYDATFALSFFTHMPKTTFGPWLKALYQTVSPGGCFIFTTHGYGSLANVHGAEMPSDGFLYMESSEQKDIDVKEYGAAIVKPEYVLSQLIETTGSHHIVYKQANWDAQDLWIVHCT